MKPVLRSVSTGFWDDPYIEALTTNEKLMFLYLLTNSRKTLLGVYEITLKKIMYETGIELEQVNKMFEKFEQDGKVIYKDNYVILVNNLKHQNFNTNMKINVEENLKILPSEIRDLVQQRVLKPLKAFKSLWKREREIKKDEGESESEAAEKIPFDKFWTEYDYKKGDREKVKLKWNNLPLATQKEVMAYLPRYKLSTPNKQYRQHPQTFLNNKTWNDEIIMDEKNGAISPFTHWKSNLTGKDSQLIEFDNEKEVGKLKRCDGTGEPFRITKYDLLKQYSPVSQ